ncbi:spore coat protein [Cohnella sp. CFH 77786]|uniref:spore coat protein n=1 Tax=Cohnella sp. CFH 77786 TaxID=2662265 RepID=UPI001C6097A3|nr:spore coat protein [Cohnella sp. CFH 77786]MBW5448249.1 spore coat protein [Cohnella sp. CFH 77786]
MPYGAHETMETHEILSEKINAICHFNLYAQQAKNPQLRDMIVRHQQDAIRSYNEMVNYTHAYTSTPTAPSMSNMTNATPQQIQYGLHNPQPVGPVTGTALGDREIATALLICHKNGASNAMRAALECADPNLRRMMINSSVACADHAFETFLFMNRQGLYQVPTMNDQTAKTFMHSYQSYQPANYGGPGGGTMRPVM